MDNIEVYDKLYQEIARLSEDLHDKIDMLNTRLETVEGHLEDMGGFQRTRFVDGQLTTATKG